MGMKRATVAGDAGEVGRGSRHGRTHEENQAERGGVAKSSPARRERLIRVQIEECRLVLEKDRAIAFAIFVNGGA